MPELNPCPICSSLSVGLCPGEDEITHEIYNQAFCTSCGVSGPRVFADEISAISAWNSLPRALTWTTEPPKVEHVGKWFWSKLPGKSTVPVIVAELDGVLGIGRGTSEEGLTMTTKTIYISGPMSGLPELNYPAFNAAAAELRALGYHVENPAENPEPPCKSWEGYMRLALAQLVRCDVNVRLPGWQKSRGAVIESSISRMLNIAVCDYERFVEHGEMEAI